MKQWFLVILVAAFLASPANAAQNRPVIEDFTNNGCPPCLTIKDSLDQILSEYEHEVTVLSPHVWWPATDSFFNMDKALGGSKVAQYNINGVPDFIFGGENIEILTGVEFDTPAYYADLRAKLDSMLALTSPLAIDVTHFKTDTQLFVSGTVTVEETLANQNARLAYFLTQTWQRDPNNPSNKWYHILRDAEPIFDSLTYNVEGSPMTVYEFGLPITMTPGAVIPFDFVIDYDASAWQLNPNIANPRVLLSNIVVFRGNNNKVLQSFSQEIPEAVGVPPAGEQLRLVLEQNTPNPFNPTTKIRYSLSHPSEVSLDVYGVSGRLVRNLVTGFQDASTYEVIWDGKDDRGRPAGSGVYYYSLNADKKAETRKMILIR